MASATRHAGRMGTPNLRPAATNFPVLEGGVLVALPLAPAIGTPSWCHDATNVFIADTAN